MRAESDKIARGIPFQKNLGADSVPGSPRDEISSYDCRLLGLSGDVARDEGEGECLGGPEGEG